MTLTIEEAADAIARRLEDARDDDDAEQMASYMKTDMPFYGVKAKPRDKIMRDVASGLEINSREQYEILVRTLWERTHREEKYIAIRLARRYGEYVDVDSMSLYEELVREGAWWDFVDEIATHLVGDALAKSPQQVWPILDAWITDDDMWIRRTAMLAQNRAGDDTDVERLFDYALTLAAEDEFFIRKAVGWALREYADVDADAVTDFLEAHRADFSNLTLREASKHIEDFDV
jgi:3-methyladenine DNA glycosylase AlkD